MPALSAGSPALCWASRRLPDGSRDAPPPRGALGDRLLLSARLGLWLHHDDAPICPGVTVVGRSLSHVDCTPLLTGLQGRQRFVIRPGCYLRFWPPGTVGQARSSRVCPAGE